MKNSELTISVGKHSFPIFLQQGFFNPSQGMPPPHKHRYTEIHLAGQGRCEYLVEGVAYGINEGTALLIPHEKFHHCLSAEEGAQTAAFQIPLPVSQPLLKPVPPLLTRKAVDLIAQGDDYGKLSATLALILSEFFLFPEPIRPIRDPAFLIYERFSNEYARDLTVKKIAEELNLSVKQTERLILKYTGNTFRQELTRRRMEAARHLLETSDLSLAHVAEQVGYRSYSGFWKAFHREQNGEK